MHATTGSCFFPTEKINIIQNKLNVYANEITCCYHFTKANLIKNSAVVPGEIVLYIEANADHQHIPSVIETALERTLPSELVTVLSPSNLEHYKLTRDVINDLKGSAANLLPTSTAEPAPA
jgi:hypothetical protein